MGVSGQFPMMDAERRFRLLFHVVRLSRSERHQAIRIQRTRRGTSRSSAGQRQVIGGPNSSFNIGSITLA